MKETEKKAIVDSLVANCDCWGEEDREVLNSFKDEKLEALNNNVTTNTERKTQLEEVGGKFKDGEREYTYNKDKQKWIGSGEIKPKEEEVVVNKDKTKTVEQPKQLTEDEWMARAPANIQSVVANSLAFEAKRRKECIAVVVANEAFAYTEEQLETKELGELQILANAAAPTQSAKPLYAPTSYAGQQGAPQQTINQDDDFDEDDVLVPAVWNEKNKEFATA